MLTHFLDLLTWIDSHPWQVVGLTVLWSLSYVIVRVCYARWIAHEQRKVESTPLVQPEPIHWPPPAGKKGFARRQL